MESLYKLAAVFTLVTMFIVVLKDVRRFAQRDGLTGLPLWLFYLLVVSAMTVALWYLGVRV